MSRSGSADVPLGSEVGHFDTQEHFDYLWDFLSRWHLLDPHSNPEARKQVPTAWCDYAPLREAIQRAERQGCPVSGVIKEVWSEVPDWFRFRLLELEGHLIPEWEVSREEFGYLFDTGRKSKRRGPWIGDYQLLSKVGQGGMGYVLKGFDPRERPGVERLRAIKLLPPDHQVPDGWERFVREARKLRGLSHQNIVRLHKFPDPQPQTIPFFSMEYVYGPTLHDLVSFHRERGGLVDLGLATDLIRQIAEGLYYIESKDRSLVHRDLKPQNVLLVRSPVHPLIPHGWRVKITDFGLATGSEDPALTGKGDIVGTLLYMAPEQLDGTPADEITPAADIYALGVIAYELMTGVNPFRGDDYRMRMARVLRQIEIEKLRSLNSSVPKRLEQLIERMMAKEASKRPSCQEVLDELKAGKESRHPLQKRVFRWCGAVLLLSAFLGVCGFFEYKRQERNALDREIVILLQESKWGNEQLTQLSGLLASMAAHDPEIANRRWDEFGKKVRDHIASKQRLDEGDEVVIRKAIEILRDHDEASAGKLSKAFQDRRSSFQEQWQWPGTDPDAIFDPGMVAQESKGLALRQAAAGGNLPRVVTQMKCGAGGSRLRVEFGEPWLDATEIGLELNCEEKNHGYIFSLHPVRAIDEPESGILVPTTFRAAREMGQAIELRILHHQVVLQRFRYDAGKFPGGSLAMTAERHGAILALTVDGVGGLKFKDVFATPGMKDGAARYAIHWPRSVHILNLRAEEVRQPATPSPLERGDQFYSQLTLQKYSEALAAYEQAGREDVDGKWRTELQYKKGLCKVKLGHDVAEAADLFRSILEKGDEQWRPDAYVQLWSLYLKQGQKGTPDADALIAHKERYLPHLDLAKLVRRVPEADALTILEYYRARVPSSHATGLSNEEQIRLAMNWVDADEFLFGDSTESHFWLSRAYSRAKKYGLALSALDSLSQKDQNLNILAERIWLLRRLKRFDKALEILDTLASAKRIGSTPTEKIILSILRAECHADQEHWDIVLAGLDPNNLNADLSAGPDGQQIRLWLRRDWLPRAWLMRGFARISLDSKADVRDDWVNASRNVDDPTDKSGLLAYLVPRSLAGVSDMKDVNAFVKRVGAERGGSNLFAAAEQALKALAFFSSRREGPNAEEIMKNVVREMWRTEEGRRLARAYAFRTWGVEEQPSKSKTLAACEFLRQHALHHSEDPDQWAVCWAVAEEGLSYASGGGAKLDMITYVSAWFGKGEHEEIDVLFEKIPAEHRSLRAPAAYVLAHRMLSLNRPNSMKEAEYYLRRAQEFSEAPGASDPHLTDTLKAMIEKDLHLLSRGNGILVLKSDWPGKVYLSELKDGKLTRSEELVSGVPKEVKAGTYQLEWEGTGDVKLMPSEVRVGACHRQSVVISRGK
jgi:serine/threonine protein kinase